MRFDVRGVRCEVSVEWGGGGGRPAQGSLGGWGGGDQRRIRRAGELVTLGLLASVTVVQLAEFQFK
jgi:hypothetical protein